MFSPASKKAHPERVRAFASAFTSFDKAVAAVTARTVLTRFPGLGEVLPRLAVPTTILMGAEDRLYPVERMRLFAALAPNATRELAMLDAAKTLDFMRSPPGNRLEALKGGRAGQWSVRINDQWRVCFVWTDAGPDQVEIVDYH